MPYLSRPSGSEPLRTIALVEGDVAGLAPALREHGVTVLQSTSDRIDVEVGGTRHRITLGEGRVAVRAHRSLWQRLTFATAPPAPAELFATLHGVLQELDGCELRGWTTDSFAIPASAPDSPIGPNRTWATFRADDFPIEGFGDEETGPFISEDGALGAHVAEAVREALEARGHETDAVQLEESWSWFRCRIAGIAQTVCVTTLGTGEYDAPEEPEFSVVLCGLNRWSEGAGMAALELHEVLRELDVEELQWWDAKAEHGALRP